MNLLHSTKKKLIEEPTQEEIALNFLEVQNSGVLATIDPNNNPHATVIYYSVDPSFNIRFLTKKQTKKSDNLARNSHAMFVVYDEILQTVVQITGRVQEVTDENDTHEAFINTLRSSLHTASNAIPPIVKVDAGENIAYKLIPVELKMTAYNGRSSTQTNKGLKNINLSF